MGGVAEDLKEVLGSWGGEGGGLVDQRCTMIDFVERGGSSEKMVENPHRQGLFKVPRADAVDRSMVRDRSMVQGKCPRDEISTTKGRNQAQSGRTRGFRRMEGE